MSTQDKKDAILKVFATHIQGNDYTFFANMWESEYADKPKFGMVDFLKVLYEQVDMSIAKNELVKLLNAALLELKNSSAGRSNLSNLDCAYFELFKIMYLDITKDLDEPQNMQLADKQFNALVNESAVNGKIAQIFLAWMRKRGGNLNPIKLPDSVLKSMFNKAYFYCCEVFGPSKADRFLSDALAKANTSPCSKLASPTDLISA